MLLEEVDSGFDLYGEMSWFFWYDGDFLFDLNGDDGFLLFFDEDVLFCFLNCYFFEILVFIDFCFRKLVGVGFDFFVKFVFFD